MMRARVRQRSSRTPVHVRGRDSGIALIEALVSILIFSFGLLGLIGLEARAINFSVNSEDRNRAALLANDVASAMWLAGNVTLNTATLAALQTRVADATSGGLANGTLTIAAVAGTTNSADITITWRPTSNASTDPPDRLTTRVTLP